MRMITAFQAENGKIYALEEKANIAIWIAEHFTRKLR